MNPLPSKFRKHPLAVFGAERVIDLELTIKFYTYPRT